MNIVKQRLVSSTLTQKFSVLRGTEISVPRPYYRNFCVKVDETSFKLYFAFIFYSIPLFANEIVTWKFCVVLHRLMQDGDAKVIAGSIKHGSLIGNFTF